MISHHSYPLGKMIPDYLRALLGAGICLVPFFGGFGLSGALWLVLGLALIFILFGLRTAGRQIQRITLSPGGISARTLWQSEIPWAELEEMSLSYYSTWRNKSGGWMQLKLKGAGRTLRMESTLSDFKQVVRQAESQARVHDLTLDETTRRNFQALDQGLEKGGELSLRQDGAPS